MSRVILALSMFFIVPMTAQADHKVPGGSLSRLSQDTNRLVREVQYSYLRYHVKQAVYRFGSDVRRFYSCTASFPAPRWQTWDHDIIPDSCEHQMHRLERSWYQVHRYLHDTYYDFPRVYRAYRRVRSAIRVMPF